MQEHHQQLTGRGVVQDPHSGGAHEVLCHSTRSNQLLRQLLLLVQIEERKQHQARLLDKLSSIQVPSLKTSSPRLVSVEFNAVR